MQRVLYGRGVCDVAKPCAGPGLSDTIGLCDLSLDLVVAQLMDVTPVGVVRDRLCPERVLVVEVGDLSVVAGLPLVKSAGGVLSFAFLLF